MSDRVSRALNVHMGLADRLSGYRGNAALVAAVRADQATEATLRARDADAGLMDAHHSAAYRPSQEVRLLMDEEARRVKEYAAACHDVGI